MTWLRRLLAALFPPPTVRHRFEPFACRERQKWAARAAAFSPNDPPARRRLSTQDGFQ